MSVDPTIPTSVPPIISSEQDLDPDALEDEDYREELKRDEQDPRPEDWEEPPAAAPDLPEIDEPRLIRDDLN